MKITCPNCPTELIVPVQMHGKNVRCPTCKTEFPAAGLARLFAELPEAEIVDMPAAQDALPADRDLPSSLDEADARFYGWQMARSGMKLIFNSTLALMVVILIGGLLFVSMGDERRFDPELARFSGLAAWLFLAGAIGSLVVHVVGTIRLLKSPDRLAHARASGHLMFLFGFIVLFLATSIYQQSQRVQVWFDNPIDEKVGLAAVGLRFIVQFCLVLSTIFMILFLHQVGRSFDSSRLVRQCHTFLVVLFAVGSLPFAAVVYFGPNLATNSMYGVVVEFCLLMFVLVMMGWFLGTVSTAMKTIRDHYLDELLAQAEQHSTQDDDDENGP